MKITDQEIGLRAQDIQTGLQDVGLGGPASGLLDTTRLIGMAERLAIHIRGAEVIDDYERLCAVGSRLGIDSLVLPNVLEVLEEAEFVTVQRGGTRVVYEDVPYFGDIYERLGSLWRSRRTTEIEQASVHLLQTLASAPLTANDLSQSLGLTKPDLALIKDLGDTGGYIRAYRSPSDGDEVVYSPLFWDEHPEAVYSLLKKYTAEEIAAAIGGVREYQGLPLLDLTSTPTRETQILLEAINYGILPTPAVDASRGKRYFAFTPYAGSLPLSASEKAVVQKARAVLACIRYGQHFGGITKIRHPELILNALAEKGRLGAHSEIGRQYSLLVMEGVGRIVKDSIYSDRYHFVLIDTEDNKKALAVARDMLVVGEAITERGLDKPVRDVLFSSGVVQEPLTTLAEFKRNPKYSDESIKRDFERLVDRVRGGLI